MSAASNSLENAFLELLFKNTDFANVGDAAGLQNSAAAGSLYVSLHTADPGEAGSQTTSEATYTSYARVAIARSGAGWTVTANAVVPAATITFPTSTGGTNTITHFGIGTDAAGAGTLLVKGAVTPNISVVTGVTPKLAASSSVSVE